MSEQRLDTLPPGTRFTHGGILYERIATEKISCCSSYVAINVETGAKVKLNARMTVQTEEE